MKRGNSFLKDFLFHLLYQSTCILLRQLNISNVYLSAHRAGLAGALTVMPDLISLPRT
jgi:hypothetical protein